jgi:hypothetical protein
MRAREFEENQCRKDGHDVSGLRINSAPIRSSSSIRPTLQNGQSVLCIAFFLYPQDHLDIAGQRDLFLFHEEKLVLANVFRTKLVGRFAEAVCKLSDGVWVSANGGWRVMADLQILQHALAKCGHEKAPFVVITPQNCNLKPDPVMSCLGPPEA